MGEVYIRIPLAQTDPRCNLGLCEISREILGFPECSSHAKVRFQAIGERRPDLKVFFPGSGDSIGPRTPLDACNSHF